MMRNLNEARPYPLNCKAHGFDHLVENKGMKSMRDDMV